MKVRDAILGFLAPSQLRFGIGWQRSFRLVLSLLVLPTLWHPSAIACSDDGNTQSGHLLLLGGGEISPEIRSLFLELAGGADARIVIIPTASQSAADPEFIESLREPWYQLPLKSLVVLHARDRFQANDPDFLRPLSQATGVWISGGVQSRLAERYLGTRVESELLGIISRNGIVAGTSAGAAIMTRVMIADGLRHPVLAPGLDLLPNAIVDQHFRQRYRMTRLATAIEISPNRFGIGIDEGTGLLVHGDTARVLGAGQVRCLARPAASDFDALPLLVRDYSPGETVNLKFWRELDHRTVTHVQQSESLSREGLNSQCRIATSLAYSLSIDYQHFDLRR